MKMRLNYDNLDDAKVKLAGTYCMYKGKAVSIQLLEQPTPAENKYLAHGTYMFSGRTVIIDIDDPEFNCSNYNIGYVNQMTRAAWFYRVPMKQWRQGLRYDQVRAKASRREFADIGFKPGKNLCSMLENSYPEFKAATELLKEEQANIVAFNKNFAMTFDRIHSDFILEYKGTIIGFTNNLKDMKLMAEHEHLIEALKEAVK